MKLLFHAKNKKFAVGLVSILTIVGVFYRICFSESFSAASVTEYHAKSDKVMYLDEIRLDNGTGVKIGLSIFKPEAFQGYTLLAPVAGDKTWLIDMYGRIVHTWKHESPPFLGAKLLENGHLLRSTQVKFKSNAQESRREYRGKIQEFDWEGGLVWDYMLPDQNIFHHHDCIKLPNGNVMATARELRPVQFAREAGWKGEIPSPTEYFPCDCILEIKPTGKTSGEIVWRWNVVDHILQDIDRSKPNYVPPEHVADHAELVDLNYQAPIHKTPEELHREMEALRAIGYLGADQPRSSSPTAHHTEWTHFNSVDYNPRLDQVMIGAREFCEVWIVDHSASTAEAASHVGGRYGKGGDLLYRWGNPAAYRCGKPEDQILFFQHNAHWIPDGLPGAGRLLTFNNGDNRPAGAFSSIDEVTLPAEVNGVFRKPSRSQFTPKKPTWSYSSEKKDDFFSQRISGVQRLPNGNTLICSGIHGIIFEVTPEGEIVWKFVNPVGTAPPRNIGATDMEVEPDTGGKVVPTANGLAEIPLYNPLFRAYRYGVDFPAFTGKQMKPGISLKEYQRNQNIARESK